MTEMHTHHLLLWTMLFLAVPSVSRAQVAAHYRQAADVFEILDNVSNWWPGYSNQQYRGYWEKHLGLSTTDEELLSEYARLRERHFDKTGQNNEDPSVSEGGLFSARTTLHADPVGEAFFRSETVGEALERLQDVLDPSEIQFLGRFYTNFEDRYLPLVTEHEQAVRASLAETNRVLADPAYRDWLSSVERFFNVPGPTEGLEALYVWWPDSVRVVANPRGTFLVLRALVKPGEELNASDVISHEVVHVISALQPSEQKRSITDRFLRECPASRSVGRLNTIEEPLAVVFGNMQVTQRFRPDRYRYSKRWYGDEWVDLYAKLLFGPLQESVDAGRSITGGFLDQAVPLCQTLLTLRNR
jgi:hypothetical protein